MRYVALGTFDGRHFFSMKTLRIPLAMADASRKKTLEELRNEAIAELERRGFDVRGETPAQIRKLLRQRPNNRSSKQTETAWRSDRRD